MSSVSDPQYAHVQACFPPTQQESTLREYAGGGSRTQASNNLTFPALNVSMKPTENNAGKSSNEYTSPRGPLAGTAGNNLSDITSKASTTNNAGISSTGIIGVHQSSVEEEDYEKQQLYLQEQLRLVQQKMLLQKQRQTQQQGAYPYKS